MNPITSRIIEVGIVLAIVGVIFYLGGVGPRAELAKYKVEVAAASARVEAKNAADKKDSDNLIKAKDQTYVEALNSVDAYWTEWMRQHPSGEGRAKPVRIVAGICQDDGGNQRLSDAVQRFRQDLSDAVGDYRQAVAGLVKEAGRNTAGFLELRDWANNEQKIHGSAR